MILSARPAEILEKEEKEGIPGSSFGSTPGYQWELGKATYSGLQFPYQ